MSTVQKFPNLVRLIFSQITFYIVIFSFLIPAVQKFYFLERGRFLLMEDLQIWSEQFSQKNSYFLSFNFLCSAVQKFYFGGFLARSSTKLGKSNCNKVKSHFGLKVCTTVYFKISIFSKVLRAFFSESYVLVISRNGAGQLDLERLRCRMVIS